MDREGNECLALNHGVTVRARGGEDILLDDLERLGIQIDPGSQLVILCEVCGRPSTKVCVLRNHKNLR